MAYKNWSKRQIKKQITQVDSLGDKTDKEILRQLLNNSIRPFDPECYPINSDFDKEILREYNYYFEYIIELYLLPEEKFDYPSLIQIPISSQLEFLHDFFLEVTPKWIDIFNNIYKERKRNLKIGTSGSYSVYLKSIDYSYISTNKEYLIDDLFSLVHEYTHAIVDRLSYREDYNSDYPFIELPSLNMELISSLFMPITYADIEDEINFYLRYMLYLIRDYAENIISIAIRLDSQKLMEVYPLNQKRQYQSKDYTRSLIHDISYVIPFIHVVEMFYLYKDDKEKWFYTLNEIIHMGKSNNYLNDMKKLGLTPNKNIELFINDLKISR